ncbi:MAG: hypothetical protein PHV16_04160 [Candidatus Nanoarchaeia archaeon]|nr:hypothetical protein [Candidatus Nanoarchaeia archaeon]
MNEEPVGVYTIYQIKRKRKGIDPISLLGKCEYIPKNKFKDILENYKISEIFGLELPLKFRFENGYSPENGYNNGNCNSSLIIRKRMVNDYGLLEKEKEPLENILERAEESMLEKDCCRDEEELKNNLFNFMLDYILQLPENYMDEKSIMKLKTMSNIIKNLGYEDYLDDYVKKMPGVGDRKKEIILEEVNKYLSKPKHS